MESLKISTHNVSAINEEDFLKSYNLYVGDSESYAFGSQILEKPFNGCTPFSVWCEKSGFVINGNSFQTSYYEYQRKRRILGMSKSFIDVEFDVISEIFKSPYTYVMTEYPFVGTNLDGLVRLEDGKLLGVSIALVPCNFNCQFCQIPCYCWSQVQHSMLVTGFKEYFLIVEYGAKIFVRRIERDVDYQELLLDKIVSFWGMVESGKKPPICNQRCEYPYFDLFPKKVEERDELAEMAKKFFLAKKEKNRADFFYFELENIFNKLLPPGCKIKAGDHFISRNIYIQHILDVQKLKENEPGIYSQYLKSVEKSSYCLEVCEDTSWVKKYGKKPKKTGDEEP